MYIYKKLHLSFLGKLLLFLICLASSNLYSQIQIGTGSSDEKLPIEPFYGYSYSQVIYLASEINASGTITQLKWYFDGSSLSNSNNWTIYIGHTTKTSFSSTSDWIAVSGLTQIYSATFTNPGAYGWLTIDITDWAYNGTDNLVVAVDENKSSYNGSSDEFNCTSVSGYRGLEFHSDGTNPNPSSPPSGTRKAYIANIILDGISQSCPAPSTQTETNITQTSVDLNWTETGSATIWDIEWGATGFTQGSGTTVSGITSKPYTLSSGLSGGTTYDWYVRADCGSSSTSSWVGPHSFTTLAPTQTIPFTENWETGAIGSAWNYNTGGDATIQVNTSSKHNGTYGLEQYGDGGSYTTPSGLADAYTKAQVGGVNESHTSWNSFTIDLTNASSPAFSFWYSLGRSYNNNYNFFWAQIDAGAGWVDLFSVQPSGSTIPYEKKTFDLSSYIGGTVIIRFFHNGKYDNDYLYLDDISVSEFTCPEPSNQLVSNIATTSVQLNWTEGGTATTWDIEWGAAGFTQGGGTTVSGITSKPYTLSSLSANNAYDWYVRADCGSGSSSSWIGPNTFSTTITSFPWTEGFENSGSIPNGWEQEFVSGTHNWIFHTGGHSNSNPSSAHSGTYNACFDHVSSNSKTKLITPQLDISSLSNPQLSFWHTQQVYDGDQDELRVYYKTSQAGSWILIPGAVFTSSISSWTLETFNLPSASTTYYIGFEGLDDYGYGVCIDDVLVEGASCSSPSALSASSITTTTAQLNWTENGSATVWEIEYGAYGFTQGNGTSISNITSKPHNLSGLSSGTKYDWYVRADCGSSNYSNWSSKNTFTSTCVSQSLPWNEGFENLGVYGTYEFPGCWDGDNGNMFTTSNTIQSDNREPNTGSSYIYTIYDADDWLFTPAFDLTAGTIYEFSSY